MKNRYYLGLLVAVATLTFGACQNQKQENGSESLQQIVESSLEVMTDNSEKVNGLIGKNGKPLIGSNGKPVLNLKVTHRVLDSVQQEVNVVDSTQIEESSLVNDSISDKTSKSEQVFENDSVNHSSSTVSTAKPNNVSTSTKPNTPTSNSTNNSNGVTKPNNNNNNNNNNNQSSSSTNQPTTPPVVEEKPQPQPPVQPSEPALQPTPPVVEQPTPPVVEETKKPVDILDWNYIKSTLIAKGESLGMVHETSMNRELDGWESPWQSSYMTVTNEDVIGYISTQMTRIANAGYIYYNLDMVVQSDGNVLIYLISTGFN